MVSGVKQSFKISRKKVIGCKEPIKRCCLCGCILTGWPGGGAAVLLFGSRYVAGQRLGGPGQRRPLLRAAVRPLLNLKKKAKRSGALQALADAVPTETLRHPLLSSFTFPAHLLGGGGGREHAEEGRTSQSAAATAGGIPLRLQAEPGRGGWLRSDARRWTAIFNRTALVGLWSEACGDGVTDRWREADVRWDEVEAEKCTY